MNRARLRIVVAGVVGGEPGHGGAAWAILHWALAAAALGHEVALLDVVSTARRVPVGAPLGASVNAASFREAARQLPTSVRTAEVDLETGESVGATGSEIDGFVGGADVLFNANGVLTAPCWLDPPERRVYLDLDPGFTQAWYESGLWLRYEGHTHFVTVGLNVGHPHCGVPTNGRRWVNTLPPVDLARWPASPPPEGAALTTVGHWRSYGSVEQDGIFLGQKAHSARSLLSLPSKSALRLRPALAIAPGDDRDRQALLAGGWELDDPAHAAATTNRYRAYVQRSAGELGIAKLGYVATQCGWVSDRSACYLASGRPVVAQDTGTGDQLEVGEGFLTFTDEESAAKAIAEVASDLDGHGRAARRLAERRFDGRKVLAALVDCLLDERAA